MGFYLRKFLNFGGFRVNFSKSGLGASYGFKGMRFGTGPSGNYVHAGQNGLYYKKFFSFKKSAQQTPEKESIGENESLREVSADSLVYVNFRKAVLFYCFYGSILISAFILSPAFGNLVLIFYVFMGIRLFFKEKKFAVATVHYDKTEAKQFNSKLISELQPALGKCHYVWLLELMDCSKTKKGQIASCERLQLSGIRKITIPYFEINVPIYGFEAGDYFKCGFLPDCLIVYQNQKVISFSTEGMDLKAYNYSFRERECQPRDAQLIGYHWRFSKKDGSPDNRFKDNFKIPSYRYCSLHFYHHAQKIFSLMFSNIDAGLKTKQILEQIYVKKQGSSQKKNSEFDENLELVVPIIAHLCWADGNISDKEAEVIIKRLLKNCLNDENSKKNIYRLLNETARSSIPFSEYCQKFYERYSSSREVLEISLDIFWDVSISDNELHEKEEIMLSTVAETFKRPGYYNEKIEERVREKQRRRQQEKEEEMRRKEQERSHSERQERNREEPADEFKVPSDINECYLILESSPNNSDKEIKLKYYELVKRFHPDYIQSKGLHPDFMHFAGEKIKRINTAYEKVMAFRSLN